MKLEQLFEASYETYGKYVALKKFNQYGPFFSVLAVDYDEDSKEASLGFVLNDGKTVKDLEHWLQKNNVRYTDVEELEGEWDPEDEDDSQKMYVKVSHR